MTLVCGLVSLFLLDGWRSWTVLASIAYAIAQCSCPLLVFATICSIAACWCSMSTALAPAMANVPVLALRIATVNGLGWLMPACHLALFVVCFCCLMLFSAWRWCFLPERPLLCACVLF